MTKAQQRKLVRGLCRNTLRSLLETSSRWPSEWDGHELRALIADRFALNNFGACDPRRKSNKARRRAYLNSLIVLNLP